MTEIPEQVLKVQADPAPVNVAERIGSLDLLRGFAVLGILVMNIQSFSMPDPAYFNPTTYGDLTGINLAVWTLSHLLTDLKFMSIFSILFGAGMVLLCQRLEQSGIKPSGIYYRRVLWLLVFGILHAYLLWHGDILVWYSVTALVAYLFWRVRPGWLMFWSLLALLVGAGLYALFQWSMPNWPEEAIQGNKLWWLPGEEVMRHRLEVYRGGWTGQMAERASSSLMLHTFIYAIYGLWRTLGMMLAGMALMKWGILSAKRSRKFYGGVAVTGLAIGLSITVYGVWQNYSHQWAMDYSMFGGSLFNYWGSLPIAMAYLSIVMLWHLSRRGKRFHSLLVSVGRMAFSCYILQTLVCTSLFYGHGFGFFGMVPRWGQPLIVVGVLVMVIVFAEIWLRRFRYGPLEWLWRSLTYGRFQPTR